MKTPSRWYSGPKLSPTWESVVSASAAASRLSQSEAGSLQPYGDELGNADDFYESLRDNFTIDDTFYCAPKDFSTLALVMNTAACRRSRRAGRC